ncbi:hypothetical protein [Dactylococcopsis salina]|uniref:hypothetical protein n=1 Tax=Dactylococcopsis salina TaxID=292566 RepID=UPI000305DA84|nr:hypothetical protein [Dactylococcopsis salina]
MDSVFNVTTRDQPDRVEMANLNRMPGATPKMADQQWYKVDYLKHLISRYHSRRDRALSLTPALASGKPPNKT